MVHISFKFIITFQVKDVRLIDAEEIVRLEPNCRGLRAIHSPHTGIVDWRVVAVSYGEDFTQSGGDIYSGFQVAKIRQSGGASTSGSAEYPVTIESEQKEEIRYLTSPIRNDIVTQRHLFS